MSDDAIERGLHDKATRGIELSHDERAQLDQWYAAQDTAEAAALAIPASPVLTDLQAEVTAALARSIELAQNIQKLAEENNALRHEIDLLHQQVARRFPLQPV